MSEVQQLYLQWLVKRAEGTSQAFERLCWMLFQFPFRRRVGHDMNRAVNGANLRLYFLDEYDHLDINEVNDLLALDCTWLEMLVALSMDLDFYYDGGIRNRFLELITNMGLEPVLFSKGVGQDPDPFAAVDLELVEIVTRRVDENRFDADGRGGLFPLSYPISIDQREVEIWEQHAAYFREKLEGDLGLLQVED